MEPVIEPQRPEIFNRIWNPDNSGPQDRTLKATFLHHFHSQFQRKYILRWYSCVFCSSCGRWLILCALLLALLILRSQFAEWFWVLLLALLILRSLDDSANSVFCFVQSAVIEWFCMFCCLSCLSCSRWMVLRVLLSALLILRSLNVSCGFIQTGNSMDPNRLPPSQRQSVPPEGHKKEMKKGRLM